MSFSIENTIFCDTSAIARIDRKTGIERVVRAILAHLMSDPLVGFRIVPTVVDGDGIAPNRSMIDDVESSIFEGLDRDGDHFVMLDWAPDQMLSLDGWLTRFRANGGRVTAVIYDLLPIEHPAAFPAWLQHTVSDWLDLLVRQADVVACISRAVANSFADLTTQRLPLRDSPIDLAWFHLGSDISASQPSIGHPPDSDAILASVRARPTLMVVGTVEPRKGHDQLLAAMETLWEDEVEVGLVIVGRKGWMVDELADAIRASERRGRPIHWLEGVSDEFMDKLFVNAAGLVAPSIGEGFGLPLIEASVHGLPILARNIPVFREVAGRHASYFEGPSPLSLAAAVRTFLNDWRRNLLPSSSDMTRLTWASSASDFTDIVLGKRRYMRAEAGIRRAVDTKL